MPTNIVIGLPLIGQEVPENTPQETTIRARLFDLINNTSFQPADNPANTGDDNNKLYEILYEGGGDNFVSNQPLLEKLSSYALNLVHSSNMVLFNFLDKEAKEAKRKELLMAYYYLYAQWELHRLYGRRYQLSTYADALKQCADQIKRLNLLLEYTTPSPELQYNLEIDPVEGHTQYFGVDLALWIRDCIYEFKQGKTITMKDLIGIINGRRLYWIWAGNTISALLDVIPQTLKGIEHAQKSLASIGRVTGFMSFIIYYLRFSIDALVLMSHVIENRWMTEAERDLHASTWDRFIYHGKQRFFSLVNDGIWATANILCFMVLYGNQTKVNANNFLTLGLLVMDLCLLFWQYQIELNRHEDYINELLSQKTNIERALVEDPANVNLLAEEKRLNQMIQDAEFEWKYKRLHMLNSLSYALGLILTFSILCVYGYPPAVMNILGVVGAGLCFTINLISAMRTGYLEIRKCNETRTMAKARANFLLNEFNNTPAENSSLQKQLYLEIRDQLAQSEHERRMINYQRISLVRAIVFDVIFPSAVMVSLLFLATGPGIGVIAAVMVLGLLSHLLMEKVIKPKLLEGEPAVLPAFDEAGFEHFKAHPSLANIKSGFSPATTGIFSSTAPKDDSEGSGMDDEEDSLLPDHDVG